MSRTGSPGSGSGSGSGGGEEIAPTSNNPELFDLKRLLLQLPNRNYQILKYLIGFLNSIVTFSEYNKMHKENVAIIFGPLIVGPKAQGGKGKGGKGGMPALPDVSGPAGVVSLLLEDSGFVLGRECTAEGWVKMYIEGGEGE